MIRAHGWLSLVTSIGGLVLVAGAHTKIFMAHRLPDRDAREHLGRTKKPRVLLC